MKRLLIELTDREYDLFINGKSYFGYTDAIKEKLKSAVDIDEKEVKMYLVSSFGFLKYYEPLRVFFDFEKAKEYVHMLESCDNGYDYKIEEINAGDYKVELPKIHRYAVRFTENAIVAEEENVPEDTIMDKSWISISGTKDGIRIRLNDKDKPSAIKNAKSILKDMNKKYLSVDE